MNDWIDRKEVLEEIEDDASNGVYSCFASYKDAQKFKKIIKSINSRAHGKWIEQEEFDGGIYYDCSVCGNSWTTIDGTPIDNNMNYCPNCGADMREGTK